MNNLQLREYIIRPTLIELDMYSQNAEDLVAGTIAQESQMGQFIKQIGGGPALGICQMESATHNDLWDNWIGYRSEIERKIRSMAVNCDDDELIWNLKYSIAMCRLHYYRSPDAIPDDIHGQAKMWKKVYNTAFGKGTEADYVLNYGRYAIRKD